MLFVLLIRPTLNAFLSYLILCAAVLIRCVIVISQINRTLELAGNKQGSENSSYAICDVNMCIKEIYRDLNLGKNMKLDVIKMISL